MREHVISSRRHVIELIRSLGIGLNRPAELNDHDCRAVNYFPAWIQYYFAFQHATGLGSQYRRYNQK